MDNFLPGILNSFMAASTYTHFARSANVPYGMSFLRRIIISGLKSLTSAEDTARFTFSFIFAFFFPIVYIWENNPKFYSGQGFFIEKLGFILNGVSGKCRGD